LNNLEPFESRNLLNFWASRKHNSRLNNGKVNTGDIMKRSGILVVAIALIVTMASLASTAYGVCSECGGTQDWAASANNFLEGKPINDTPSSLSNPEQARLRNELNSNLINENTSKASNSPNNPAQAPALNISLKDARAMPNPVNSGSPVMITADFGNSSSNYLGNAPTYNVSAIIRNSAELDVGKVNLERASGEEYAGMWITNVTAGAYKATIVASAFGASKTFNDALRMEVSKAA
jgi:hypothetical protein